MDFNHIALFEVKPQWHSASLTLHDNMKHHVHPEVGHGLLDNVQLSIRLHGFHHVNWTILNKTHSQYPRSLFHLALIDSMIPGHQWPSTYRLGDFTAWIRTSGVCDI